LPAALQTLLFWCWPLEPIELCQALYRDGFTVDPVDMPPLVFLSEPAASEAILALAVWPQLPRKTSQR
jgi:hypothetical protein